MASGWLPPFKRRLAAPALVIAALLVGAPAGAVPPASGVSNPAPCTGRFEDVDADLKKSFDSRVGSPRYRGTPTEVIAAVQAQLVTAKAHAACLDRIAEESLRRGDDVVAVRALARRGSVFDSVRTGLFETHEPALVLAYVIANVASVERAYELWRKKRDQELEGLDADVALSYGKAIALAERKGIATEADRAWRRMAFYSVIWGDERMKRLTEAVVGFSYRDGMFFRAPGRVTSSDVLVPVLPGSGGNR
jgi:hypothetical protein